VAFGLGSVYQVIRLYWSGLHAWDKIDDAWQTVYDDEQPKPAPDVRDSGG
jgi:hypothetical protein